MRWVVGILLMIVLAIAFSLLVTQGSGYVLILKPPYRFELSFNFFLVILLLFFMVLHLILRLVHFLRRLPMNVRKQKEAQRLLDGNTALLEGMHALAAGDMESARKAAERAKTLVQNEDLDRLIQTIGISQQKKIDLQNPSK